MSVESLINDAQAYSSEVLENAIVALDDASSMLMAVGYSIPNFTPVNLPSAPPSSISLTLPTLSSVDLNLPPEPSAALVFQDIPSVDAGVAPTLDATAPTLTMPSKPSDLATFTSTIPTVDLSSSFPVAPSLIMPEAPVLPVRTEPTAPTTVMPSFGGQMPTNLAAAPDDLEGSFNAAYRGAAPEFITMVNGYCDAQLAKFNPQYSNQMTRIEAQLTKYLAGGTGLSPEVEDAIYARAQAKNDLEAKRMQDAAFADNAARGFTLPAGVMVSALARARQEAANNNAKAANEIAIAQAEMEQKNLQFAVTTSTGLRTAMVNATLSYMQNVAGLNGQALDYAKSMLGALVETYNTAVKAFTVKLEAYKTEASVFETLMRGALAGVELYKAEISALQALTQVDQSKVDVYKARIDVLTAASNMYRTQVEAVVSKASLEKLKIDVFQAQVQAYGAQVSAKNAEWQGYSAAIGGEEARARIFNTQVQAYGAQVQGYNADISAKVEIVKAAATTNDARARQYSATMSGYQTVVQAKGEVARTQLENQRQQITAFQAQTQAAVADAQVKNEYYKALASVGISNAELQMKAMLGEIDSKTKYQGVLAELATSSAKIYGDLAGAAVSGMNTLVANTQAT